MREKIIAGNWKMHKTVAEAVEFAVMLNSILGEGATKKLRKIVLFSGATCLMPLAHAAKPMGFLTGAQNVHWETSGAFTGEISAAQIKETGATYALVGHSERRQYFGETDQTVCKRTLAAAKSGLKVVVCVGEVRAQRESGQWKSVLKIQLEQAFLEFPANLVSQIIVAYEPVWAIGTGLVATADEAQEAIAFLRGVFKNLFGAQAAETLPILYGGSMNETNAHSLLSMPDIDGGLIGGAALDAAKFAKIIQTVV